MLKIVIGYPTKEDEKINHSSEYWKQFPPQTTPIIQPAAILQARQMVRDVYMGWEDRKYIVDIVFCESQSAWL